MAKTIVERVKKRIILLMQTRSGWSLTSALRIVFAILLIHAPRRTQQDIGKLFAKYGLIHHLTPVSFRRRDLGVFESWLYRYAQKKLAASEGMDCYSLFYALSMGKYAFETCHQVDLKEDLLLKSGSLTALLFKTPFLMDAVQFEEATSFLTKLFTHMERILNNHQNPDAGRRMSANVAESYQFIPMLFTWRNLRSFAVSAGRCIECFMKSEGHELDYDRGVGSSSKRLRVGILVRDMEARTESYIAAAFSGGLDRQRFHPIMITLAGPGTNSFSGFMRAHCEELAVVEEKDIRGQVSAIRSLGLDILIICNTLAAQSSGYLMLLAHRLAAIQVIPSAIWPVTTGLTRTDYVLTAAVTEPPGRVQEHYSERVMLMEGMFNCFAMGDMHPGVNQSKSEIKVQIPKRPVSFASGGSAHKLVPELKKAWAEILQAIPDSELLIYPFSPNWGTPSNCRHISDHLRIEFEEAGVPGDRLTILPVLSPGEIVELLKHVTVYLDTFPYSGAASFIEPLVALCPAVTLRGTTQRGMQGSAMMGALGLDELIADTPGRYVELAISTALNPGLRERMARRMAEAAPSVSFLDIKSFGARLGRALEKMAAEVRSGSAGKGSRQRTAP